MRTSAVPAARRGLLCLAAACLLTAAAPAGQGVTNSGGVRDAGKPATGRPAAGKPAPAKQAAKPADAKPVQRESARIPFRERFSVTQHGGIVRTANSAISCRSTKGTAGAAACRAARAGGSADNHQFDMFYSDVDKDPNTYDSSRAQLSLPAGSTVSYARLYWGGNLRVGEQKPAAANGRVLFAEPGGAYKPVLADTVIGHSATPSADVYQSSADVTKVVRRSGPGVYTVAQANVAMGRSAVGAFGGWTLVVAYKKADQPLRHLALWDGFGALDAKHRALEADVRNVRAPAGAAGRFGVVGYDGDRGVAGDGITVGTDRGRAVKLANKANKSDDVMNSSITDNGANRIKRQPDYANNLGYDSDVFDLKGALAPGGDRLAVRFGTGSDSLWLGAFFVEAKARS